MSKNLSQLTKSELLKEYIKLRKTHHDFCKAVGVDSGNPLVATPKHPVNKTSRECPKGYVLNPVTNKCVKDTGRVGRKILTDRCNKEHNKRS